MSDAAKHAAMEAAEEAAVEATCLIDNKLDVLEGFDPEEEPALAPLMAHIRDALLSYAMAVLAFRETPENVAQAFAAMSPGGVERDDLEGEIRKLQGRMRRALARQAEGSLA